MMNGYVTPEELDLLSRGNWYASYEKFGAHLTCENGEAGCAFTVWAPDVKKVCVAGSFNDWKYDDFAMLPSEKGGVWHLFIPGVRQGDIYKYVIETASGEVLFKADPYGFYAEVQKEGGRRWDTSSLITRLPRKR